MNIEEEIFKRSNINIDKLIKYGFKKSKDTYIYEKNFLDDSFKAVITITDALKGKVIDLETNEEYINIRTKMMGSFVNKVREEYEKILLDIKKNCFIETPFISDQSNRVTKYIKDKYNDDPEFLWEKYPGFGIFRNKNNNKWYAALMNIDYSKFSDRSGEVEIINIKIDKNKLNDLLKIPGIYEAYHMNKKSWITIVLDDTLDDKEVFKLLDESYEIIDKP